MGQLGIEYSTTLEQLYYLLPTHSIFTTHLGSASGSYESNLYMYDEISTATGDIGAGELLVLKLHQGCVYLFFSRDDTNHTSRVYYIFYSENGNHKFDAKWKKVNITDV